MSNLTIRQAVQGMLKLQDSGDHATMVGIGPMSPNLIQAVFELARDEDGGLSNRTGATDII